MMFGQKRNLKITVALTILVIAIATGIDAAKLIHQREKSFMLFPSLLSKSQKNWELTWQNNCFGTLKTKYAGTKDTRSFTGTAQINLDYGHSLINLTAKIKLEFNELLQLGASLITLTDGNNSELLTLGSIGVNPITIHLNSIGLKPLTFNIPGVVELIEINNSDYGIRYPLFSTRNMAGKDFKLALTTNNTSCENKGLPIAKIVSDVATNKNLFNQIFESFK
jgi:hypothetical protein